MHLITPAQALIEYFLAKTSNDSSKSNKLFEDYFDSFYLI